MMADEKAKALQAAEDAALEEEIRKRREKVLQWQLSRKPAAAAAAEGPSAAATATTAAATGNGSSLKRYQADDDEIVVKKQRKSEDDDFDNDASKKKGEEEEDPLDAYMREIEENTETKKNATAATQPQQQKSTPSRTTATTAAANQSSSNNNNNNSNNNNADGTNVVDEEDGDELDALLHAEENGDGGAAHGMSMEELLQSLLKNKTAKELQLVDHSKIDYVPFQKKLYTESPDLKRLSEREVAELRASMENIKFRGKNCPTPLKEWSQSGLSHKILDTLKRLEFHKPTHIQAQALPALMMGRDVIGCAKTGSGKTLAFVLPMIRHIAAQPDLAPGEGPVGLILAPTRELATQIYLDARKFCVPMDMSITCLYGGAGMGKQIGDLKRGVHIAVATPGRLIDLLCLNNGKVLSLRRVTFLVLDEADRMFDMGFEPQITRVVQLTRPDRQTCLFSATFPRAVEQLAKSILKHQPLEIVVGGRSVVCGDVDQQVAVVEADEKFPRLLQLLGEHYSLGNILVFVDKQDTADNLFQRLLKAKYTCQALHGGKDQFDRDTILADFKSGLVPLLIATSVVARGLDVKTLNLVVNYSAPDHLEDYIHRVGRTGRAGRKGKAVTFITPQEEALAPNIEKALKDSMQPVPDDLAALVAKYNANTNASKKKSARLRRGKGFTFTSEDQNQHKHEMEVQIREMGIADELGLEDGDGDSDDDERPGLHDQSNAAVAAAGATAGTGADAKPEDALTQVLRRMGMKVDEGFAAPKEGKVETALNGVVQSSNGVETIYIAEVEVNDYSQPTRWIVTGADNMNKIMEEFRVGLVSRGAWIEPGKPPPNEKVRKLYLVIDGKVQENVRAARKKIESIIYQSELMIVNSKQGKYQVL